MGLVELGWLGLSWIGLVWCGWFVGSFKLQAVVKFYLTCKWK
jgi:hypothetical protein